MKSTIRILLVALLTLASSTKMASADDVTPSLPAQEHAPSAKPSAGSDELPEMQAIAQHGFSAPRLLALGRAQRQRGELGAAIASFERARLLEPRNAELREELRGAKVQAGLARESPSALERVAGHLSIREWTAAASSATLALSLFLLAWAAWPQRRRLFAPFSAVSLLCAALAVVGLVVTREALLRAIVVQHGAELQQSPFEAAQGVLQLSAGEAVQLTTDRRGGYVRVRHPSGIEGWLARDHVAPLAAAAFTRG